MATTPSDPTTLVGRWIRLERDGGRPPHVGVLTRCDPSPGGDRPGLWHWALRTPTGYMIGGPHLPADELTREHRSDVTRARRQLARRLAADRATLAALLEHDEPAAVMARAVAALEDLQNSLHTQITADPSLWSHPDLRYIPAEQHPDVVTDDHRTDRDPDGTWQIRVGPAYQADVVRIALDQGDDLHIARDRGKCAETRQRLAEGRWVPPRRDLDVARVLVEDSVDAAVRRAMRTELDWDTCLCHGLLIWQWAERHRGATRYLDDLRMLAVAMYGDGA